MKRLLNIILLFAIAAASVFAASPQKTTAEKIQKRTPISLQTTTKMRDETRYVVFLLERGHYLKTPVSELDVREFIREYMQNIDFFKMFFTSEDVQYFQDFFSPSIEIMLAQGTLLPAFSIYDRFLERSDSRLKWIKERMKKPFDLESDGTFRPDRNKEEWPSNMAAADDLWEKRITYDIVNQILGYSDELDELTEEPESVEQMEQTVQKDEKTAVAADGAEKRAAETKKAGAEIEKEKKSAPENF